jgi:hypothetical protein
MLKSNFKPKVVKPKTKHHKPIPKYTQHHKKEKMGFFPNFPHSNGLIQDSAPPRPLYSSGGGIPYSSTFQSFGITNKPPYFLDSLIAKSSTSNYEMPVKPETSSTLTGMNPMNGNEGKTKQFPTQAKTQSVQYMDLVAPAKSKDAETQPDYVALTPTKKVEQSSTFSKGKDKEINENRRMGNEEVGQRITEHKLKRKKEIKENILKRIETKKNLRGEKKNNEEL